MQRERDIPSGATYTVTAFDDDSEGNSAVIETPPLSSFGARRRMAQAIVDFEARRDAHGRIEVYKLPKGDGGGRFEVAGINERYHPDVCLRLVALIEAGQHAEAERLAGEFIANYTDVVDRWCSVAAIEFYLRDCAFNRGPAGAAWIVQRACGVTTDMIVGETTRAAIREREHEPRLLLDGLVTARQAYEREKVGRDESSRFWKGLARRWTKAKDIALTFLEPIDDAVVEGAGARVSAAVMEAASDAASITLSADGKRAIGSGGLSIAYRGSDTCPYGQSATSRKKPFCAIVVHHTDPRFDVDWYVNYQLEGDPERGGHFGYHFYIGYDGRIIQGAPLTKRTNHVKPAGAAERRAFGKKADNTNAIGITCSGAGKPEFRPTPQQLTSLYALARALCKFYGIAFGEIYGHGEVQTDRHETEGRSAAQAMRAWPAAGAATEMAAETTFDDDRDDGAIDEAVVAAAPTPRFEVSSDYSNIVEDGDDQSEDALPLGLEASAEAVTALETGSARVRYVNQGAIRNKPCTKNIEEKLGLAVAAVYGAGCTVNIYSGGQDRKGKGKRRTGSIRHDDYGNGGRAADVHVFLPDGRQVQGVELAQLGQYWLAKEFGGVGHEMEGGGIHLDEWTTPPPGGGMFWTYVYSQNKPWGQEARRRLELGLKGIEP